MRGIKKLTVFSRKVVSKKNSQLDLRAPTLKQTFSTQSPGDNGQPGSNGAPGPIGIFKLTNIQFEFSLG